MTNSIAERIFDGHRALSDLEDALSDAGVEFDRLSHDAYDVSLEVYDVPPAARLSEAAQRLIFDAGFFKVFVNHTDKWETHYSWDIREPFKAAAGWRVSYEHKRGDDAGTWVEKIPESWKRGSLDRVVEKPAMIAAALGEP